MAGVKVVNTGNGGFANGSWLAVPFPAEVYDDAGFHDNSTNNTRLTVPSGHAGRYVIVGHFIWDDNAVGARGLGVAKNGALTHGDIVEPVEASGVQTQMTATEILDLAVGDYVELWTIQTSGGSLFNAGNLVLTMEKLN